MISYFRIKDIRLLPFLLALGITACNPGKRPTEQSQAAMELAKAEHAAFLRLFTPYCGDTLRGQIQTSTEQQSMAFVISKCEENELRIQLILPDTLTTTLVVTALEGKLLLKHDVRNSDFSPAENTMYGGFADDKGSPDTQHFRAHAFETSMWQGYSHTKWTLSIRIHEKILEYAETKNDTLQRHYQATLP